MSSLKGRADTRLEENAQRSTILSLQRQLNEAKAKKSELVEAVYRAALDAAQGLSIEPVVAPPIDPREGDEETAVIVFSDLQLGQVTASYNSEVAEDRAAVYAQKIIALTNLQRANHPIRNARLYLLGDLIEGELIFAHQPHQIDSSVFQQVALDGPRILINFVRTLLTSFERVDVVSVPGNHGDVGGGSRKQYDPETNFDRMLSTIVAQRFEDEPRVSFRIPSGQGRSSFYAVDYVGDTGFMLWHGHQARRTSSSSHLPFYKLVMGWASGAIPEPFQVSLCGHHHTPTMLTMNRVTHFINGTFASDSEYAVERLAATGRAAQWLLFAKPGRGVTAQYLVHLDAATSSHGQSSRKDLRRVRANQAAQRVLSRPK